jgi:hypothetical protein
MAEDKKDGKKSSWRMKSPFRRGPVKADSGEGRGQTTSTLSLPGPSKTPPIPVEPPKNVGSVQLPKAVKPEVSVLSTDPPVLAEATLGDPAPAELQPTVETSKPKGDYSTNKLLLWDEAYDALKTNDQTKSTIVTYEKLLMDPKEGQVEDASLLDGKSGPERMNILLERSLEKTAKLDKVEGKIAPAIDIVLSVKHTIGTAISPIPIAAAAWTPICIALQVSSYVNSGICRLADLARDFL